MERTDLGQHRFSEKPLVESTLETVSIVSKERRTIYQTQGRIEAPNWSPDGRWFYFNGGGRIYRLRGRARVSAERKSLARLSLTNVKVNASK